MTNPRHSRLPVGATNARTCDVAYSAANIGTLNGERFYRFAEYDRQRPFMMTLVSPTDHWLFISSTGALTAGRGSPDQALFPYYTEDKLHDSAEITGSKTILQVQVKESTLLWEPFSERQRGQYRLQRNLYKHLRGHQLIFEECNQDLSLVFRYGWFLSERFGFVRQAWLHNAGASPARLSLLDGLQNLMPSGIDNRFQLEKSVLLDAYKRNELVPETGLGLFRLSSIPLDRPEPAEALCTTTVWSLGLEPSRKLLCSLQLERFRQGLPVRQETDVRAQRGAYLIQADLALAAGQTCHWFFGADINRTASDAAALNLFLLNCRRDLKESRSSRKARRGIRPRTSEGRGALALATPQEDVALGTVELEKLVASADGLQKTARALGDARHYSNALFNIMRGGVFEHGYTVEIEDLETFIRYANRQTAARHAKFFQRLRKLIQPSAKAKNRKGPAGPQTGVTYGQLTALAAAAGDPDLERLCREYLPLSFSRRHGDPSRPWNRFNIAPKKADGSRSLSYEGNWRDIFQNWEALAVSFPGYTSGMLCRFVNASTADGYNPYRLTREGIDWEVPDPADPWSHIGYWGDHQVIYLTKLLENLRDHRPAELRQLLTSEIFCYANVPYRIKPYEQLLANPKETVSFDAAAQELVNRRVPQRGADGKLVWDQHGRVVHVNLAEKLLVPVLAKLSNFIPDAGLWLNTQRPEWNDANNALVGQGASMVTLYYLRRHLALCRDLLTELDEMPIRLSREVARYLQDLAHILERKERAKTAGAAESKLAARRRQVLNELGRAGSCYRQILYNRGFSGARTSLKAKAICDFFQRAIEWVEASIRSNRRADGLYHAYNLARFSKPGEIPLRRLYEMLEGQVAVLSSGYLSAGESLEVLRALKRSALYRPDQLSYLLYPDRRLPGFLESNNIPRKAVATSRLLRRLEQDRNNSVAERDCQGRWHFNGSLRNAGDLGRVLDRLATAGYGPLVKKERTRLLELFECVFDHQSFTGRSGTFFGYEGLGCIYWHMVSKLLLAVQETFFRVAAPQDGPAASGEGARCTQADASALHELAACYWEIRSGLGDYKTPAEYGAFPMDPYSHTPGQGGARQPGLTGQVKEDFLCRLGELGVFVREGRIRFCPWLLGRGEFLSQAAEFDYFDVTGAARRLALPVSALAFTYCQVPIVYELGQEECVSVYFANGTQRRELGLSLTKEVSQAIFERTGEVERLGVQLVLNMFPNGLDQGFDIGLV